MLVYNANGRATMSNTEAVFGVTIVGNLFLTTEFLSIWQQLLLKESLHT